MANAPCIPEYTNIVLNKRWRKRLQRRDITISDSQYPDYSNRNAVVYTIVKYIINKYVLFLPILITVIILNYIQFE